MSDGTGLILLVAIVIAALWLGARSGKDRCIMCFKKVHRGEGLDIPTGCICSKKCWDEWKEGGE